MVNFRRVTIKLTNFTTIILTDETFVNMILPFNEAKQCLVVVIKVKNVVTLG